MESSSERTASNKEHTYVKLSQEDPADARVVLASEDEVGDLVPDSNQSDLSVTSRPRVGLLTKSRFSDITLKLSSAIFYGVCSFLITVINKITLTTYAFPSSNILGVGQMIAIILILKIASQFKVITVRRVSYRNKKIWILATIYVCNLMTGLGGTKILPLPMFIALRRFSIAMTAIGEYCLLHVEQSFVVILTIIAMIGGSFVAAASDLTFNALGYLLVMLGNLFTAANVVFIKKTIDSREINKHEILYYSALYTIIPLVIISIFTNKLETLSNYPHWTDFGFILSFLTSSAMGYLLLSSTILCTHYNSPLTTTIVGTLKVGQKCSLTPSNTYSEISNGPINQLQNILTTYAGMYIGGDYKYSTLNFIGLNISLVGSLIYSYLTFVHKPTTKETAIKS